MSKPSITIRPALATDIPSLLSMDVAANGAHPVTYIPWKSSCDRYAVYMDRHLHFLKHPGWCQYLVATVPASQPRSDYELSVLDGEERVKGEGDEVVGYLFGRMPKKGLGSGAKEKVGEKEGEKKEEEYVEWNPVLPGDVMNKEFFAYFLGHTNAVQKDWKRDDQWELEGLAISPNYQRQGIGAKLIGEWFKSAVDKDEEMKDVYVFSSLKGRGLYLKMGFKEVASMETDLKKYGVDTPYPNYLLIREGRA